MLQAGQAVGQMVDGIVGPGQGTVTAGIGHRQLIVGIQFFRRVHGHELRLALLRQNSAAVVVEHKLGIDQFAVVLDQPIHAVRGAALFIGGQRQDDVAVRHEAFLLEADQGRDHDGIAVLHVLRAPAVVVTIFLHELKGVGGPVLAPGLNHVEVSDQQHRLVLAAAVQTGPPGSSCDRSAP